MPKLTLYHAAPSRSSIVHWMLEEVGEPYDIHLVSFKKGENLQARVSGGQSDGQGAGAPARRRRSSPRRPPSAPTWPTSSRRPS